MLGYTADKMALFFDVPAEVFKAHAADETSEIHRRIQRGILRSQATEELEILKAAEKGNVTASQQLSKIKMARQWAFSRTDLLAGPDLSHYHQLQDFLQSGSYAGISEEEEIYLQALELMAHMSRKFGRRNTVRYFVKKGLKHQRASQMFDEAINLFWIDHNISKKAYRNMYAEQLEEVARQVMTNINSAKDAEAYGKLITQAAKMRELDKQDPQQLSPELFTKPVRIYSLDVADIDLPPINRNELARQIDDLELPTADKERLRKDAMLMPINFIETLHGLKEESKEE